MDIAQLLSQPVSSGLDAVEAARESQRRQAAGAVGKNEELKAVAQQFEGIFIQQILKQMQETIQESSFDPEDSSNDQVHSLYCTFLTDAVSERGGLGLWETIYEQMSRMQATDDGGQTVDASV